MNFLVTGAAGRLGSQLVKLLSEHDHNIRAFDLPQVDWSIFDELKNIECFPGDITDNIKVAQSCSDVDVIIHLAAILPPSSELHRETTLKVNVVGTKNLLDTINSDTVVILASSISAYGITDNAESFIREDHELQKHNIYSESKISAECLVIASGNPYVILRVAPIAVADLLELPDVLPYRADQRIEFIDVEDAAYAFFQASICSEAIGKTLNVAGGKTWQMMGSDYIDEFYGALGIEVDPFYSEDYTALDWYDTKEGRFLNYQRTSFYDFKRKLNNVAAKLGLI